MDKCILCQRVVDDNDVYERAIVINRTEYDIVYCGDCVPIDIAERRVDGTPRCVMCIVPNRATTTRNDEMGKPMPLCDDDATVIDAIRRHIHVTLTA